MALTEKNMEGLVNISEFLRMITNRVGRASTWLLVPLVIITMWDVVARKIVVIQIFMVANFGSFLNQPLCRKWNGISIQLCFV